MSKAGIREFKAHLSAYIRRVKRGEVVLLTERGEVIAEVRPAAVDHADDTAEQRMARMVERGEVRPGRTPGARPLKGWKGIGAPRGEARRLLELVRGEIGWLQGTSKPAR